MAADGAPRLATPLAVYLALGAGLLALASSAILIRYAGAAPPLAVAVWRTVFAVLLLVPAILLRPQTRASIRRFSGRDWLLIAGAGVLLGFHFITWIESVYLTTVASASVLVTTSPIFLAVFGFFFLGERPRLRTVVGIGVAMSGAVLIGLGDASAETAPPRALMGNGLALLAAVLVSGYLLIGRVVRQGVPWLAYVFPLYSVAAGTILALALLRGVPLGGHPVLVYGLCALMALGPQLLGHGSFNYAVKYIPAAVLGLLSLLEPVGASVMALILFGEQPPLVALVGMILVLAAVGLALVRRPTRRRNPVHPT